MGDVSTVFWQEIRKSLFIRGEGWQAVLIELPQVISYPEARKLLQSKEQLGDACLSGLGYIAGQPVTGKLDKEVVQSLASHTLDFENCAMQWLYRYYIVAGLCEHWRSKPLADWPPAHLDLIVLGLHFMVYMAALMCLFEEDKLESLSEGLMEYTAHDVRERVKLSTVNIYPKSTDYGESFRNHGLPGLIPRLWDKIARITQLKADNRPANFEKLGDSVCDLLGYSIIALSLTLELPEEVRNPQPQVVVGANVN